MSRNHGAVLEQLGRVFGRGTVAGLSEGSLLQRFAQGKDEAAFAALVARHGPMVLGVCRRVLRDEHDVEDAFQATFLVLVRRAGAIRHGELVGHWLYGVAHRVAVRARANAAKRHARTPLFAETDGLESRSVLKDHNHELRAIIDEELARLPDSIRAPIVLCYLEGLTHEEAASRLGWPVGTVRSRMARGRDTLRHRLSRRGVTANDATLGSVLAPVSLSLPTPLLDATVKASLSFFTTGATSAALASASAISLAQGVLHAMTLIKISALGAVALSGAIALSGWQTYGRPSQDADKQPNVKRSSDTPARVTELDAKLEKIAARLDSLEKENQDLRKLLEAQKSSKTDADPKTPSATRGGGASSGAAAPQTGMMGSGGMMPGMRGIGRGMPGGMMGGGMAAPVDDNQPQSTRLGDLIFVSSPDGNKVSMFDIQSGKARALSLSDTKGPRHQVLLMQGSGCFSLVISGPAIKRIAVYVPLTSDKKGGVWYPQDLVESTDTASPTASGNYVFYKIGRRVYAFSVTAEKWGVLEIPEGATSLTRTGSNIGGAGPLEFTFKNHIYNFDETTAKWRDKKLDLNAILNAPEDGAGSSGPPR